MKVNYEDPKELDKIENLSEIKKIIKIMEEEKLDTTYAYKIKKKLLLKEIHNPNSNIGKMYTTIIISSKDK